MKVYLAVLCLFLCACTIDPAGMTTRQDIRARAQVEIAKAEERAEIGKAREEALGKEGVARAWSGILPTIAFLIMGGLVSIFLVRRNERITIAQMQYKPQIHVLSHNPTFHELSIAAKSQGLTVVMEENKAVLYNEVGMRIGQRNLIESH